MEGDVSRNANVNELQNAATDQPSATSLPTTGVTTSGSKTPKGDPPVPDTDPSAPTARVVAARKARINRFLDVLSENTVKYEFSDKLYKKADGWYDLIDSLTADTNLDEVTKLDEIRNAQQAAQEFDNAIECFE